MLLDVVHCFKFNSWSLFLAHLCNWHLYVCSFLSVCLSICKNWLSSREIILSHARKVGSPAKITSTDTVKTQQKTLARKWTQGRKSNRRAWTNKHTDKRTLPTHNLPCFVVDNNYSRNVHINHKWLPMSYGIKHFLATIGLSVKTLSQTSIKYWQSVCVMKMGRFVFTTDWLRHYRFMQNFNF